MTNIPEAFSRLQEGARSYSQTNAKERIERLDKLWEAMLEAMPALTKAAYDEMNMDAEGVMGQMMMVKSEIDFAKKHLAKWMKPKRVKGSSASIGKKAYVRPQAKGVVLNLSAWNAPIAISFVPVVAALAAGNTVCIKPSELGPRSADVIADLVNKAFDPTEVIAINGGAETAAELLRQPFNHIYYTGGQRVGGIVMKAAADHFASVTLEMGGKNGSIVDETADIKDAAQKTAWGRFISSGQACVAPDYVVVHESVYEDYVRQLTEFVEAMFNSDKKGFENSPYVARIINEQHTQRIADLIDDAVSKGAKVRLGGNYDIAKRYVAPTILTDVSDDMAVMQNEVFGPVLCVIPYSTREEAVQIVDKRRKSLAFYIFSKNQDNIEYFTKNTESGGLCINHNVVHAGTNPNLPFGGVNQSGIGRIGGYRGFMEMSTERGVLVQPMDFRNFNINFPPYTDFYKKVLNAAFK